MSGFSVEWLSLREPADVAARSADVTAAVLASIHVPAGRLSKDAHARRALDADMLSETSSPRVIDLGSGTGSNVRYLAPRLANGHWHLFDNDPALLSVARVSSPCPVETHVADLRVLDDHIFDDCSLVTASALLDLVSEAWLTRLVALTRRTECRVLMALNYDGRIECSPADSDDELVRELVNRHQRTDKGFGPALGPDAGAAADALLRAVGYEVHCAKSDWHLGPEHLELQRQLIEGWAQAATELAPELALRIQSWTARRMQHLSSGASHLIVGHDDVGGIPVR